MQDRQAELLIPGLDPSLKELDGLGICLRERVTHLPCERLELVESAFLVTGLLLGKHGFVIGLSGGNEVIEDTGEFMRRILDGLWGAVAGALRAVVISQIGFVIVKGLGGESKGGRGAVLGFRVTASDAAAGAEAVFAA